MKDYKGWSAKFRSASLRLTNAAKKARKQGFN